MKVGIFGGSFDPPHHGHIALARTAMERLDLDRVLIAPVGTQPFKGDEAAPFEDRVAIVRLAIAGEPRMEVCATGVQANPRRGLSHEGLSRSMRDFGCSIGCQRRNCGSIIRGPLRNLRRSRTAIA